MNRSGSAFVVAVLTLAAVALLVRLPRLGARPMHPDEANQAYKAGRLLWQEGRYEYDPHDHHGPSLYYLTLPSLALSGAPDFARTTAAAYRIVPVLFGAALLVLLLLVGDGLGRAGAAMAALFMAVSPAMVFYSRCYIQETLLVFFTLAAIGCLWRYARSRAPGWMLLAGAAAGLMVATKETWIIAALAAAVAFVIVRLLMPRGREGAPAAQAVKAWHAGAAAAVAVGVAVAFFTSFFTQGRGAMDAVLAYGYMLGERAGGAGLHDHPWTFYLARLAWFHEGAGPVWTEGLIVGLAVIGLVAGVAGRGLGRASVPFLRFVAIFTLIVAAVYSAVPYKTPWCVLTMLAGMILLAGVGAAAVLRWARLRQGFGGRARWLPLRAAVGVALAAGVAHLGYLTYETNFSPRFQADPRNPWVYAHTSPNVRRLVDLLEKLKAVYPGPGEMVVKVITPDNYWPLPWYLRVFDDRYAHEIPADADSPVVITTLDFADQVRRALRGEYEDRPTFGLRFGVPIRVFVARDLWERFERECTKAPGGREGAAGPATAGEGIAVQHRFTHQAMATEFAIVISGGEAEYAGRAADAAFELLDRLEGELSRFRSASDVSRINGLAPGESIRVGPETIECLAAARRAYDETGGAFDPTVGPLVDLWRAGTPAAADLEVARARVGMDLLAVDAAERTVGARAAGMSVDLGGIGKGYALDRMAALLAEWRVRSALVHGGLSTALAVGPPPGEEAWRVEIRDPRQGGATLAVVALRDRALSVSGAGEGAPRLFDPRTGRPVEGRLGAWAIAPTATEADALSTAFMVMTPEEIASLCRKRPDLAAMVVPEGPAAGGSASPCVARFAEQGAERFGDWGS